MGFPSPGDYFLKLKLFILGNNLYAQNTQTSTLRQLNSCYTPLKHEWYPILDHVMILQETQLVWCKERNISLTVSHLSRTLNEEPDKASRAFHDDVEWSLNNTVFERLCILVSSGCLYAQLG